MDIFLSIVAVLLALVGIVGCVVPVIPGVVLSYAALLCLRFTSFGEVSAAALLLWLLATVAVTAADYYLPAWMARRFGGSRAGMIGATVGMFAGVFVPFPGLLLGPFAGALAGELLHDGRDWRRALRVGVGSFLSFIVGTGLKLAVSLGLLVHIAGILIGTFF